MAIREAQTVQMTEKQPDPPFANPALVARWVEFAEQLTREEGFDPREVANVALVAAGRINAGAYGQRGAADGFLMLAALLLEELKARSDATKH
jgi:hypothetical protein